MVEVLSAVPGRTSLETDVRPETAAGPAAPPTEAAAGRESEAWPRRPALDAASLLIAVSAPRFVEPPLEALPGALEGVPGATAAPAGAVGAEPVRAVEPIGDAAAEAALEAS